MPKPRIVQSLLGLLLLVGLLIGMMTAGVTSSIPVGRVEGQFLSKETGRPLEKALVTFLELGQNKFLRGDQASVTTDAEGRFRLGNLAEGTYDVQVTARGHQLTEAVKIQVREGRATSIKKSLDRLPAEMRVYSSRRVFLPEDKPFVQAQGFLRTKQLDVKVFALDLATIVRSGDIRSAIGEDAKAATSNAKPILERKIDLDSADGEGNFSETIEFESLKPGIYLLEARGAYADSETEKKDGALRQRALFFVSEIALVAKSSGTQADLWLTDLRTGKPLADQAVQLNAGGSLSYLGKTNNDGLLEAPLPILGNQGSRSLAFVAQVAGSTAVTVLNQYGSDRLGNSTVITDRPIYLPGDTVQYRAVFRRFGANQDELRLPSASSATAVLRDNDGEVVGTQTVTMTRFGSASGSFALPEDDARPFSIDITAGGQQATKYVPVSAYRKPEFRVTVSPVKPYYLRGDRVEMKVKCEYFFGGPVVGAKLTAMAQDGSLWTWADPESEESESYGEADSYLGDLPEAVTNDQGEAILSFDSSKMGWIVDRETDRMLKFDVSVTEDGERYFDGSGTVSVFRGDVDLRLEPITWVVTSKDQAEVEVITRDLDGKPVAGKTVQIEHGTEVWHQNGSVFSINGTLTATTDENGNARIRVPATREGDLHLRARTEDSRGGAVQASTYLWVTDAAYAWTSGERDLNIALDKREYAPGETMKVAVRGDPTTSGYAWLTLETGSVQQQQVVEWKNGVAETTFKAPTTAAPNAFIAATMVRDRELVQRTRSFKVSLRDRELEVQVVPRTKKTKPGEKVEWLVRTLAAGKPVSAEVSVGVVDEAIYAIREDNDSPMEDFFPRRWSSVDTAFSFPEVYLDGGDKEGKQNVEMRTEFKDTADWRPTLITDLDGEATFTTDLPDNLTSWRATAVAISADTRVGKSRGDVIAVKPLMVRLQAPLSMVQYDAFTVTAIVQNGSDGNLSVEASLESGGNPANEKFTLKPGETKTISTVVSPTEAGEIALRAVATAAGGLSDGMEVKVPVVASTVATRVYGQAELNSEESEYSLDLPAGDNDLTITVQNSRFGPLLAALPELVQYPYGCTEQTVNRFVPAVLAQQALSAATVEQAGLGTTLPNVLRDSVARLRKMQHMDGGWGWWENDPSDPFMTAVVLDGLSLAREAGVELPPRMMSRGGEWAERFDYGKKPDPKAVNYLDDDAQLAAAATRAGDAPKSLAFLQSLSPRALEDAVAAAEVALVFHRLEPGGARARGFLERAIALLDRDGERWYGEADRARVTEALVRMEPDSARTEDNVGRLLQQRRGRAWSNTYATAGAIRALLPKLMQEPMAEAVEVEIEGVDETLRVPASLGGTATLNLRGKELARAQVRLVGGSRASVSISGLNRVEANTIKAKPSDRMEVSRTFHRLVATRNPDGTQRLDADKRALTSVDGGEVIRCRVNVKVKKATEFVMVEVPLPSNMRIRESDSLEYWDYWFTGMEFFNDRVVFFARALGQGEHTFDFHLRAENQGEAQVLPARAMPMYTADDLAQSESVKMEVRP